MTVNNLARAPEISLLEKLNTLWHEKGIWIYGVVVILHQLEHVLQAAQIFILNMPRPESQGLLGFLFPLLVRTELLHTGYAILTLGGLLLLYPGFRGVAKAMWLTAIVFQAWHFFEHGLLQAQVLAGVNLWGSAVPISVGQLLVARPELHLIYNSWVTIPTILGIYFHFYPPASESKLKLDCTCSRRAARSN